MRSSRRVHSSSLLLAGGLAGTVFAGEVTIQNDSNSGFAPCQCLLSGEQVAAWLTSSCVGTIKEVQIGWGSPTGGATDSLEMEIHIDRAGTFPAPGSEITSGELTGPILVDGSINSFDASAVNATVIANETIVVSLELLNTSNPPFGPGPLYDGDGCQSGTNTVFVLPGGWTDACPQGVPGDWVIRAVVDCDACPWDCDGSDDGIVGVDDFLAVLAQWGQSGTSCDTGAGDPDVGVDEFLDVLAHWGSCP